MRRHLRPLVLVVAVVGLTWASHRFGLARHLTVDGVRSVVERSAPYGPLAFVGLCVAGILLHIPGVILIAAGGVLFDSARAFAYGWVGSILGTTATFLIVRHLARDHFQRVLHSRFARLQALDERLARQGFVTVLVLRLVLFLAPPLNWALGATRVPLPHYVAATALGVIPGIATTVVFADAIANRPPDASLPPRIVVAGVLVAILVVLAGIAARRLFGREPSASGS
jgi:uncharacterized membrane protein YdjX (TVP38/TMEM64 family)